MTLDAILWDYDGTLVNSVPKNMDITKAILARVAPHRTGDNLPECLQCEERYHHANHASKNWQELYVRFYGLSHDEMLLAGSMWAEHQQSNQTPVQLFDGLKDVLGRFSQLPHGICSQNSQANIQSELSNQDIVEPFKSIIGYDDVPNGQQKPHPFGGIKCARQLLGTRDDPFLIYVGDHEADVEFARNLQQELGGNTKVVSVAAAYSNSEPATWSTKPDHIANDVKDLMTIIGNYV